jgi:hypothetical protein
MKNGCHCQYRTCGQNALVAPRSSLLKKSCRMVYNLLIQPGRFPSGRGVRDTPEPLLQIDIKPADLKKPSVMILIAANLVPVIGAIFLGWEVFPILLLYWTENVIVGIFNVIKMALVSTQNIPQHAAKFSTIGFFCIHYGMFTFVHGIFVWVMFGFQGESSLNSTNLMQFIRDSQLIWGILALLVSHGASFILNYIGKGEYKQTTLNTLMMQPYGRVVVLHLTIIFGGFMLMAAGSPIFGLLILIVLKLGIDIIAHLKQHPEVNAILVKTRA